MSLVENPEKEQTFVFLKPDAFQRCMSGEINLRRDIIAQLKGPSKDVEPEFPPLELVAARTITLSESLAELHYKEHSDETWFEALIEYTISGPVFAMVFEGVNAVERCRKAIGATDPAEAEINSVRNKWGTPGDLLRNIIHASDSVENAKTELKLWFGKESVHDPHNRTMVFVKPEAFARQLSGEILARFEKEGFECVSAKTFQPKSGLAMVHYEALKDESFYPELIKYSTSGTVFAMALEGENAVASCRELIGATDPGDALPNTIRNKWGTSGDLLRNIIHASDSVENAIIENALWFDQGDLLETEVPESSLAERSLVFVKPDAYERQLSGEILARFEKELRCVAVKTVRVTTEVAKIHYEALAGKEFFDDLIEYTTSGPLFVMIFEGQGPGADAVALCRKIIGATDPEVAKEKDPESIRAIHGKDIMHNIVHASDSVENAKKEISLWFGPASPSVLELKVVEVVELA